MEARSVLTGLRAPHDELLGAPEVCVAVLDGPVDLSHPCFEGADLTRIGTLVTQQAGSGPMSLHGTHVTSLIFGRPGSPVTGIAPRCRGLILPVFQDADEARVPQLDLARAIERAVQEGAHVINISGGERAPDGQADELLLRALRLCEDRGVLVVAAAGNDGCDCLQVPAAVPGVLAVGATGADGRPLPISNWGAAYAENGVVAPGEAVLGAAPGGGHATATGSSFATPLVAGVAALLVAAQLRAGRPPDPRAAGRAVLDTASASPCSPGEAPECRRFLAGSLNAPRAYALISRTGETAMTNFDAAANDARPDTVRAAGTAVETGVLAAGEPAAGETGTPGDAGPAETAPPPGERTAGVLAACEGSGASQAPPADSADTPAAPPAATPAVRAASAAHPASAPAVPDHGAGAADQRAGVRPACACGGSSASECQCGGGTRRQLVYAIGTLGFDFQTEARRDSFRQQMKSHVTREGDRDIEAPPNPYDAFQLADYLAENPWASDKVTWTLNMDATPVYALEAEMPVGMDWHEPITVDTDAGMPDLRTLLENLSHPPVSVIYRKFRDALRGQVLKTSDADFVSRVSVPGVLTGRTVRLYSGQVVPVVEVKSRGVHAWNEARLVDAIIEGVKEAAVSNNTTALSDDEVKAHVRAFLDKVYYQFRNLGQTSADRALNFAGTNGFLLGSTLKEGLLSPGVTRQAVKPDGVLEPPRLGALDSVRVTKSPYCRPGSDCQDVLVSFFDPENDQRAKTVFQFTFDVSDELPVSLAPVHQFLER
ncbi:S8 family serine peptidase [Streptomyces sp. NPDC004327]|uniref:cyanobactin maturation protease PatG family protein n=1 Tax=Streptomyces sp. NPDC004327 TaxID=3364699 RepID=UPI0036ADF106